MAVNFRQIGTRVQISIPSGKGPVTSGKEAFISGVFGVPEDNALAGQTVTFHLEGMFALTMTEQGTFGVGTWLYYIYSTGLLSVGRGGNNDFAAGQIQGVLDSTNKVMMVRLCPTAPLTPLYA